MAWKTPASGASHPVDDADILTHFTNQRGLAVNKNPGSRYFGRVYISVGSAGSVAEENGAPARSVSDGIYILNPDLTATALGTEALTGGLPNLTASTESPFRMTVGPDDQMYITDWSDVTGSLYVADPNMTAAVNVLPGPPGAPNPAVAPNPPIGDSRFHGSISAVVVEGSLAAGNLNVYVVDEDPNSPTLGQPIFDFRRFFEIATAPTTIIGRDIAFDAVGNIYTVSSGQHLLRVYAPGGHTVAIETPAVPASPPQVGTVTLADGTLTIQFTSATGTPAAFQLEKTGTLGTGSWGPDAGAVVTGTAPAFSVSTPVSALDQFYRVRRL